jgi:CheY-like chemotaxis protein
LEIEFAVADSGVGIPAEQLETIFDDFTQADASTTRKYGGTGLGLSISRRIVEAMGGRLTATSAPDKGSTFRFTAQFDVAPEKAQKTHVAPKDLHGKRVLLIDDNATNCFILREMLHAWGLKSDTFRLPEDALASLPREMDGEQPYSLVIIDNYMPGMGGFEAAAEIKRVAGNLPIVMLTFDAQPGDLARRAAAGLSGYAVKPVSRPHLLRLVCDAIETRECPELHPAGSVDRKENEPVQPARLLIAEDSPDNRLLLQVYLKGRPYVLTFEEDGNAAVVRYASSDFDLILMDMRMPVMDGLAATRAIRALEHERGSAAIPIVALTANASLKDIERSVDAGCNAHLSKPISKLELLAAIEKYRRQLKSVATADPASFEPIRIEIPPGLEKLAPSYLAGRRKESSELIDLLAGADFKRLSVLGHNLKGTAGNYGFPDLARMGAALEQSAKEMDCGTLRIQMTEVSKYLDRVQLIQRSDPASRAKPN